MKKDMCYIKACAAFGNGDIKKGKALFFDEAVDLNNAREKHPSEDWKKGGKQGAIYALQAEVEELIYAMDHESEERIDAEANNVKSVVNRILNREWE